ncbi:MAG: DNA-binding response regulator [Flavobacteriaceae bacterium CG18_big_fil_WC_8_21_14_2_50_34_36]|nr:response regulator transcription factor [Flavobacteriales bacterium]PIQ19650.1 MAG: DNA-binding response regulator [Flavobacteriaceae bacterium CG18_big_fil_WC_8_21_14_2_50_34_36]
MKKIAAIIVDDEFSALKVLQKKIEKLFPELEIVGAFQQPEIAISTIDKKKPELLFLDIQMPLINGFELLSKLKEINFQVIFVTAHSDYALKAFKENAIDYLLKPIDDEELKIAVQKALESINQKRQLETNSKLINILCENLISNNKLIIPTEKGLSFISQEEVMHLEGYEGYTKIHLVNKEEILSSYNLGKFEKSLNTNFFKCHKSHIINLKKVRGFENEGFIVLENAQRIPISRLNRKIFINLFK